MRDGRRSSEVEDQKPTVADIGLTHKDIHEAAPRARMATGFGLPFSYRFFHITQIAQSCVDAPNARIACNSSSRSSESQLSIAENRPTVDRALGNGSFRVDDATVERSRVTD